MRAFAILAALLLLQQASGSERDRDILVKAAKTGRVLVVDVEMIVAAPLTQVWEVMTDWANMEKFVPGMSESDIVSKSGNVFRVRQKGRVHLGPFPIGFEAVRDIEVLPPESMRFKGVTGNFERLDGSVNLRAEGGVTRVVYTAESVPTVWVPPLVGVAMVERATREQFGEMRAEMLRHAGAKGAQSPKATGVTGQAP
jgi:carbon monoxide dehydrogenase subunit G